jgi:septum site-determining protein MinC
MPVRSAPAAATPIPSPHELPGGEAFRLRASNYNLLTLRLLTGQVEEVLPALGEQFRRAPGFLRFAPIVIGLDDLGDSRLDFAALVQGLRGLEILPLGVAGGTKELRAAAAAAGLPSLRGAGQREEATGAPPAVAPAPVAQPAPVIAAEPRAARGAMLVTQPVRAGQRIYAEGADLIITATVNAGAEVIADGHVHVYGALRGRAVAGAREDAEARIFVQNFDPELVAIAGFYAVRDELAGTPIGRPAQVRLEGENLRFEPLG